MDTCLDATAARPLDGEARQRQLDELYAARDEWTQRLKALNVLEGEETAVDCRVSLDDANCALRAEINLHTFLEGDPGDDPKAALAARLRDWAEELCPSRPAVEYHGVTEVYDAICAALPEFASRAERGDALTSRVSLEIAADGCGVQWVAWFFHLDLVSMSPLDCGYRRYLAATAAELIETTLRQARADLAKARREKEIAERVKAEIAAEAGKAVAA